MEFSKAFQIVLDNLDDCIGVALSALDGIVVEFSQNDDSVDFELLSAEYSPVIEMAIAAAETFDFNNPKEVAILSENHILVMVPVSEEYFLIMAMKSNGNYGKGRYILKKIIPLVAEEL